MIRCSFRFYPLNFYAPFVAPDGMDTGPLRHALYSDAAEPETLPPAPVCLCLLPVDLSGLAEDFLPEVSRRCAERGAVPVFAVDAAGLPREEIPAAMEAVWQKLAAAGFPGTRPFPVDAPAALSLFEGGDEGLPAEARDPALAETGIPALAERLRTLAGRVAASAPPVPAAPPPPDAAYWLDRIEAAPEEALDDVERELDAADPRRVCQEAFAALTRRRWAQKCRAAEAMIEGYEAASCADLRALADAVRGADFPQALKDQTCAKLAGRFALRQKQELDALADGAEALSLDELQERLRQVRTGPYEPQAAAGCLQRLSGQVNLRHIRLLDEVCADLDRADADRVAALRREVCAVECIPEIRAQYLGRVDRRADELALQALDEAVRGIQTMSPEELEALSRRLDGEGWSPKFVNRYRAMVRTRREAAAYRALQAEAETANRLDRPGVLALMARMESRKLPGRVMRLPLERISERLYRLDMLKLTEAENCFDSLGFAGLDALRARVEQSDACPRAKAAYLERLVRREHTLVYESTASRAALVQQLIEKCRLRQVDFDISVYTPDYDARLKRFWGGSGREQPRDIPVFLYAGPSPLGLSGSRFWYSTGRSVAFVPLAEIDNFRLSRQMLSITLMIQKVDGSFLPTTAKLFRNNAEHIGAFLNECLRGWSSPMALPESTSARGGGAPGFDRELFKEPAPARLPEGRDLSVQLREDCAAARIKEGTFTREDPEERGKLARLLQGFELSPATRILWYKAPMGLGPVREGVALGPEGIYSKTAKQPTRFFPMESIYALEVRPDRSVCVRGTDNSLVPLDLSPAMAPLVDDYVQGLRLVQLLRQEGNE